MKFVTQKTEMYQLFILNPIGNLNIIKIEKNEHKLGYNCLKDFFNSVLSPSKYFLKDVIRNI